MRRQPFSTPHDDRGSPKIPDAPTPPAALLPVDRKVTRRGIGRRPGGSRRDNRADASRFFVARRPRFHVDSYLLGSHTRAWASGSLPDNGGPLSDRNELRSPSTRAGTTKGTTHALGRPKTRGDRPRAPDRRQRRVDS